MLAGAGVRRVRNGDLEIERVAGQDAVDLAAALQAKRDVELGTARPRRILLSTSRGIV